MLHRAPLTGPRAAGVAQVGAGLLLRDAEGARVRRALGDDARARLLEGHPQVGGDTVLSGGEAALGGVLERRLPALHPALKLSGLAQPTLRLRRARLRRRLAARRRVRRRRRRAQLRVQVRERRAAARLRRRAARRRRVGRRRRAQPHNVLLRLGEGLAQTHELELLSVVAALGGAEAIGEPFVAQFLRRNLADHRRHLLRDRRRLEDLRQHAPLQELADARLARRVPLRRLLLHLRPEQRLLNVCGLRRRVGAAARRRRLGAQGIHLRLELRPPPRADDRVGGRDGELGGEGLDARFGGAEPLCAPLVARRVAFGELAVDDIEARGADVPLESVALERGRRRRELPPREIGLLRREIGLQQRGAQLLVVLEE